MDKTLLKKAAMQSVALMIAVITLSYALKHYQTITLAASTNLLENTVSANENFSDENTNSINVDQTDQPITGLENSLDYMDADTPVTDVKDMKSRINKDILQKLSDNFLVIRKPKGNSITSQLQDLYINQSIQLDLGGMEEANITSDMVLRIRGNDLFQGDPKYTEIKSTEINDDTGKSEEVVTKDFGKDFCHGIKISIHQDNKSNLYSAGVRIELDSVYAYVIYEDNNYYYIDLRKPSEVYDKVLVIDAGHGGKDVGALSKGDKYYEKNINVGVLQELKKLLDKENIKVYYTRTSDNTVFLRPRVSLANAVDCDYFISIHCNSSVVAYPNGTEVLYYDTNFKDVKSYDLANLFSDEIAKNISLKQRGIVKKANKDIYIMDKSLVPTILIEVGYLSNKNDMDYLSKQENRLAVAQGIFKGIMRAYEELPVTK